MHGQTQRMDEVSPDGDAGPNSYGYIHWAWDTDHYAQDDDSMGRGVAGGIEGMRETVGGLVGGQERQRAKEVTRCRANSSRGRRDGAREVEAQRSL